MSDSLRRSCDTKEYVYFVTSSVQICVEVCPEGTYGIEATRTCGKCDSTCLTCNMKGMEGCLTCKDGYYYDQWNSS